MFFKLIMEGGHVGAGRSYEMARYCKGDDIFSVLANAHTIPRLKKKNRTVGIKYIREISWKEYINGKKREGSDLYLNHRRFL